MKTLLFALLLAFGASNIHATNTESVRNNTEQQTPKKKKTAKKPAAKKPAAKKSFVGNHMLSLQWISWKKFGKAVITKGPEANTYNITGRQGSDCCDEQAGRNNGDFVSIEGTIRKVDDNTLIFNGKIVTKVYHINGGNEVVREGEFTFLSTQGRKYWRLQAMENPADQCTDYVDIYF